MDDNSQATDNQDAVDKTAEQSAVDAADGAGENTDSTYQAPATQEELNAIISKRVQRAEQAKEEKVRESFKDWVEPSKLAEQVTLREKIESENLELRRTVAAMQVGLDPSLAARLVGTTDEELLADAKALVEGIAPNAANRVAPGGVPEEKRGVGGGVPEDSRLELDPRELAKLVKSRSNY